MADSRRWSWSVAAPARAFVLVAASDPHAVLVALPLAICSIRVDRLERPACRGTWRTAGPLFTLIQTRRWRRCPCRQQLLGVPYEPALTLDGLQHGVAVGAVELGRQTALEVRQGQGGDQRAHGNDDIVGVALSQATASSWCSSVWLGESGADLRR
ncbi:hypothetical protein ACXX9E_29790 [Pseudomonas sp. GNP014]